MCFAEAETAECFQRAPHLLNDACRVATVGRMLAEECFDYFFLAGLSEGAPELIAPGQAAARHDLKNADQLLVKNDDAMRFFQNRAQARMGILGSGEAMPVLKERPHHVALHGARTEERDVDDEIPELPWRHLSNQLPLAWRFDLEAPQRVSGLDQFIGRWIVQGHIVDIDHPILANERRHLTIRPREVASRSGHLRRTGVNALDPPQRVGDTALHPHPELQHAHGSGSRRSSL